jgi:hypothetical protein
MPCAPILRAPAGYAMLSCMTDPTDRPKATDRPTEALTVAQAAERLGVTTNAVWQRLKRGTLTKAEESGPDGEALVLFSVTDMENRRQGRKTARQRPTDRPTQADRPTELTDRGAEAERLIARLEADNAYLRGLLDAEIEARRRADHLLAGALERLAALPATTATESSSVDATVAHSDGPGRAKPRDMEPDAVTPAASPLSRFLRWLRGDNG